MRRTVERLLRQPLVQFVLIGAVIFGIWKVQAGDAPSSPTEIHVGASDLRWLHDTWIGQFGHAPSAAEMQSAVRGYVDEEMRYREGLALGLDRDDTIVRRRLAQKYDFLLGAQAANLTATEAQLREVYDKHPERYAQPPLTTFCQVYFGPGPEGLRRAKAALSALTPTARGDSRSVTGGDSELPYPRCYDRAAPQDILRDFGPFFSKVVTGLPPGLWQGPVESGYGFHLVRAQARTSGARLDFDAARPTVDADWRKAVALEARVREDKALRDRYRVTVDQAALKRVLASDRP